MRRHIGTSAGPAMATTPSVFCIPSAAGVRARTKPVPILIVNLKNHLSVSYIYRYRYTYTWLVFYWRRVVASGPLVCCPRESVLQRTALSCIHCGPKQLLQSRRIAARVRLCTSYRLFGQFAASRFSIHSVWIVSATDKYLREYLCYIFVESVCLLCFTQNTNHLCAWDGVTECGERENNRRRSVSEVAESPLSGAPTLLQQFD